MMHDLLEHYSSWDPLFFATHFLDGLSHDIKISIMLHHPQDLETVVALDKLHEEVVEMVCQELDTMTPHYDNSPGACTEWFVPCPSLATLEPPTPGVG